jgi:peptide/nickel transport system permease protein
MTFPSIRLVTSRWQLALLTASFVLLLRLAPWLMDAATTPDTNRILGSPALAMGALFGTDELGRSLLARCAVALSLAVRGASLALVVAGTLAILLGGMAGWWRGTWVDAIISWLIGVLHTVPFLLLVAALGAVTQASWSVIYLMAGCVVWASPARLVRAEVMRIRSSAHARASRAFGFGAPAILLRVIAPAALPPVLLSLLMAFPELLILDIGLSFFGLGAQPPTPTLGRLLLQGFEKLQSAPWLAFFPLLCLISACIGLHAIVQRLQPDSFSSTAPLTDP